MPHLILVVLVAVCCRLTGLTAVAAGGQPHLIDPKAHGDARRIEGAARSFPRLPPARDALSGFPRGVETQDEVGFFYLAGGVARLLGQPRAEWAGMALVVLLGALTVGLAFTLALRLGAGRGWALLGGLLLAVWPLHVEHSRLGRIGPEAAGPPLVLLFALLYLRCCTGAGSRQADGAGPGRRRTGIGAGVVLGASFWCTPGMLWPAAVLAGGGLVLAASRGRTWLCRRVAAGGLAALLPLLALRPVPVAVVEGIWLMLLLAGSSSWIEIVGRWRLSGRWRLPVGGGGLLALVGVAAVVGPIGEAALETWWSVLGVSLAGLDPDHRPLLLLPLKHVDLLGTHLLFALPAVLLLARGAVDGAARHERTLLVLWAGAMAVLGLVQIRYGGLAAALWAPACALGFAELARRLRGRFGHRPEARWIAPALVAVAVYLVSPSIDYLVAYRFPPTALTYVQEESFRWLGARAADDEAVMAPLGIAHEVASIARRPVVGAMLRRAPMSAPTRDTAAFFTSRDPAVARRIAERRGVRWVVASRFTSEYYLHLRRALDPLSDEDSAGTEYRRALGVRLQTDRGAAAEQGTLYLAPVRWLQHRYEARFFGGLFGSFSAAQLYRVVAGARLTGRARPRELVTLGIEIETTVGRRFIYQDWARADANGAYQLLVPYATEAREPTASQATGPALIETGWGEARVEIGHQAAERGHQVPVPPLSPRPCGPSPRWAR